MKPDSRRFKVVRGFVIACAALAALLAILDFFGWAGFDRLVNQNQLALTVLSEAILVGVVYFAIDASTEQRHRKAVNRAAGYVVGGLWLDVWTLRSTLRSIFAGDDSTIPTWDFFKESVERYKKRVDAEEAYLMAAPHLTELLEDHRQAADMLSVIVDTSPDTETMRALAHTTKQQRERLDVLVDRIHDESSAIAGKMPVPRP